MRVTLCIALGAAGLEGLRHWGDESNRPANISGSALHMRGVPGGAGRPLRCFGYPPPLRWPSLGPGEYLNGT
jgi:hypothetical protein